ncbi:tyrosine-protein phosphatase non-receptor type 1-like isoform X2 [Planococcus citri]|uniref:tyrosine-protein phosphatase non-receptor type 1-like isoform X2 n=1 Tax=Planococcus citri TaxID=170843 RepID=UPI0031F9FACF
MSYELENSTPEMRNTLKLEFDNIEKKNSWSELFTEMNEFSTKDVQRPCSHSLDWNYVDVPEAARRYIVAKGPQFCALSKIWIKVWEENCKAIVMLGNFFESKLSSTTYWITPTRFLNAAYPDEGITEVELIDCPLTVEQISEDENPDYVVRKFNLKNTKLQQNRIIVHFQYISWPEFGIPPTTSVFFKFLDAVLQSGAFDSAYGPPLIHCSNGGGRCGTFCLIDATLQVLMTRKEVEEISILKILTKMRNTRMGLVENVEQLKFVYAAIMEKMDKIH